MVLKRERNFVVITLGTNLKKIVDLKEVDKILFNLKSGRNSFANIVPPNEAPEDREEPPIEE